MKLPHLAKTKDNDHFLLLLLTSINSLLIILIFLILPNTRNLVAGIIPISAQTPIVDFNLISPRPNSTVSGVVPLVTTLTNGPKIISAELTIDNQKVQSVTSRETQSLTLFWDSTQVADGKHQIAIQVGQNNSGISIFSTTLNVQNNATRNTK